MIVMRLFCDGHVHIHQEFNLPRFFEVALSRAEELGGPLLLFLTEGCNRNEFARLRESCEVDGAGRIGLRVPADSVSLRLERKKELEKPAVFLIAGRQVITNENLEILALCLNPDHSLNKIPDRAFPAREIVQRVLEAKAAAVVPWGLGKWLGGRGRLVKELAEDPDLIRNPLFFLGDIAHRFKPWPKPSVFKGEVRILPGTDLLPLSGIEGRLARYGFTITGEFDPDQPGLSILSLFRRGETIHEYGRRESFPSVFREQIQYRLRGGGSAS